MHFSRFERIVYFVILSLILFYLIPSFFILFQQTSKNSNDKCRCELGYSWKNSTNSSDIQDTAIYDVFRNFIGFDQENLDSTKRVVYNSWKTAVLLQDLENVVSQTQSRIHWWAKLRDFFQHFDKALNNDGKTRQKNETVTPICTRSRLKGEITTNETDDEKPPTLSEVARANPGLGPGGQFRPWHCQPRGDRVAIVIPFRNREDHLVKLLSRLHPILQRQELDYQIFVVEQFGSDLFNKAILMNSGFVESQRLSRQQSSSPFTCYIFHDVDLLPEDDRGIYNCRDRPLHLSEYIDKFGYTAFRTDDDGNILFGGVVAIKRHQFELVNGYSNLYFGWGGEDEDMGMRLVQRRLCISAADLGEYRYRMLKHTRDEQNRENDDRALLMRQSHNMMAVDGLSSLVYELKEVKLYATHTWILIGFNEKDVLHAFVKNLKAKVK